MIKGWKKKGDLRAGKTKLEERQKELYETEAGAIRKNMSITKAEIERLRANRKMSKKGKKNREKLLQELKNLSVAELITDMDREKSRLRKLNKGFWLSKKLEEAKLEDPKSVYSNFGKMLENQANSDRPVYIKEVLEAEQSNNKFKNMEEASSFGRVLWEGKNERNFQVNSNTKAEWVEEVREVMKELVPELPTKGFQLDTKDARKIISKKKNWSAPRPDGITNFWWKKAQGLQGGVARTFQATVHQAEFPLWFTGGKTNLIPKQREFKSANHRPFTCLNTQYEWYTSCLLSQASRHLEENRLMQGDQRGAMEKCRGTLDNLLLDRMVLQDAERGRRNLSMAWVDVAKAYDSVDHHWLIDMFNLHRFPSWYSEVMQKLSTSWSTRIMAKTENGLETPDTIQFNKSLPQGDTLCPLLFTLCLNPIAWKPISQKVTHLLYVDDLKVYASSENKLQRMMENVKDRMECIGLKWNERKCAVMHVKRGSLIYDGDSMKIDGLKPINCLREDSHYKFLGVRESVRQEDGLILELAAKEHR